MASPSTVGAADSRISRRSSVHSDHEAEQRENEETDALVPRSAAQAHASSPALEHPPRALLPVPHRRHALLYSISLVLAVVLVSAYLSTRSGGGSSSSIVTWNEQAAAGGDGGGGAGQAAPTGQTGSQHCTAGSPLCVVKSPYDTRAYAWSVLPSNGLPVLCVSDASAPLAGAAVDVAVGSLHDPAYKVWPAPPTSSGSYTYGYAGYPGLAHFLEHMVFMGSSAYPGENEFGSYLAANGGSSNAYTALDHTNYHFSVRSEALEGALSRFTGFFSAPLLLDNATAREVLAVDSEHQKNMLSDGWRQYQLLRHAAHPSSPWHGFSTGDRASLWKPPGVRAALLAFHAAHYCAPRMRAVIAGPHSLAALQQLAERTLSSIPSQCAPWGNATSGLRVSSMQREEAASLLSPSQPSLSLAAYPSGVAILAQEYSREEALEAIGGVYAAVLAAALSTTPSRAYPMPGTGTGQAGGQDTQDTHAPPVHVRGSMLVTPPIADTHELTVLWPLWTQSTSSHATRVGAAQYVTALLGDEGEGGLLQQLRLQQWASELSAGLDVSAGDTELLAVSIKLAPALVHATLTRGDEDGCSTQLQPALAGTLHLLSAYLRLVQESVQAEVDALLRSGSTGQGQGQGQGGEWYPAETGPTALFSPVQGVGEDPVKDLASFPPSGTAGRLWEEGVRVASLRFAFPAREDADSLSSRLAHAMQAQGPADVLADPSRYVWQPHAVLSTLLSLQLDRALILLSSSLAVPCYNNSSRHHGGLNRTEPVYGTAYGIVPLPHVDSSTSIMDHSLHLPALNPFLPAAQEVEALLSYNGGGSLGNSNSSSSSGSGSGTSSTASKGRQRQVDSIAQSVGLYDLDPSAGLPAVLVSSLLAPDTPSATTDANSTSGTGTGTGAGTPAALEWLRLAMPPVLIDTLPTCQAWQGRAEADIAAANATLAAHLPPVHAASPLLLWSQDRFFGHPRVHVGLHIPLPHAASPRDVVLTSLWAACLHEVARDAAYNAGKAGASLQFSAVSQGGSLPGSVPGGNGVLPALTAQISGYTPSLQGLVQALMDLLLPVANASALVAAVQAQADMGLDARASNSSSGSGSGTQYPLLHPRITPQVVATQLLEMGADLAASLQAEQPYVTARRLLGRTTGEVPVGLGETLAAMRALAEGRSVVDKREESGSLAAPTAVQDPEGVLAQLHAHVVRSFLATDTLSCILVHGDVTSQQALGAVYAPLAHRLWLAQAVGNLTAHEEDRGEQDQGRRQTVLKAPAGSTVVRTVASNPSDTNSAVLATWHAGCGVEPAPGIVHATPGCAPTPLPDASQGDDDMEELEDIWHAAAFTQAQSFISACDVRAAAALVLGSLLYEPAFHALRTQQSLGYIVSAGVRTTLVPLLRPPEEQEQQKSGSTLPYLRLPAVAPPVGSGSGGGGALNGGVTRASLSSHALAHAAVSSLSLYVLIQGPKVHAGVQDERAHMLMLGGHAEGPLNRSAGEEWRDSSGVWYHELLWGEEASSAEEHAAGQGGMPAALQQLPEEQVLSTASALIRQRLTPPDSPSAAYAALWSEVVSGRRGWSIGVREGAALATVTKAHVLQLYREAVLGPGARRLSVQVYSARAVGMHHDQHEHDQHEHEHDEDEKDGSGAVPGQGGPGRPVWPPRQYVAPGPASAADAGGGVVPDGDKGRRAVYPLAYATVLSNETEIEQARGGWES